MSSPRSTRIVAVLALCISSFVATAVYAAPYETVAIYSKTGAQSSDREIVLEDLMSGDHDNIVIPSAFTAEDGSSYQLSAVKEELDTLDVDKQYLAPFWDFTVGAVANHKSLAEDLLSIGHTSTTWVAGQIIEPGAKSTQVTIDIKGSLSPQ